MAYYEPNPPGVPNGHQPPHPAYPNQGYGQPAGPGYNAHPAGYPSPRGAPPPNPSYGYHAQGPPPPPQPSRHPVVTHEPQRTTVIIQREPEKPNNYLAFSICVCLLFNPLCGGIAICMSMGSRRAAERDDFKQAKKSGKCALGLNITGIILTVLGVGIGLAIYFTLGWGAVINSVTNALNSFS